MLLLAVRMGGSLMYRVINLGLTLRKVMHDLLFFPQTKLIDFLQGAMRDFAQAQSQWYPTWPTNVEDRAMVVYVLPSSPLS